MGRNTSRWLTCLVVVAATTGADITNTHAQPTTRDHRQRKPPPPPPAATAGPSEAPPTPREEKIAARAGYVWIAGRWDWRGKWEWIDGHWERERSGRSWRNGRWEQRDSRWVYVDGEWVSGAASPPTTPPAVTTNPTPPTPTPPAVTGPTSAPPQAKAEPFSPRPGFVWIEGAWDWRDNKWEWVAGHWERERAGKRWRPTRWEQREGKWARSDGDWIDATAPSEPPMPTQPPQPPRPGRRDWKLERPVVSSYWPAKGAAGSRIVIRGKNFPSNAELLFGGQPVRGVKVKPEQIVFAIPAGATSGAIELRGSGRRNLFVGNFEIAAAYDPIAEQKKLEEEARRQAEAAWAERQKLLAKDRAAREAAMKQRLEEQQASREQRRAQRVAAIQAKWERAFLSDEETQAELTLHAQRLADIARMRDLAELAANGKLVVRIDIAKSREERRHDQRMAALQASFKMGGRP
jgi:hypothetical protein